MNFTTDDLVERIGAFLNKLAIRGCDVNES